MKNQATHKYQIGDLIDFQRDERYDKNGMCKFVFFGALDKNQIEKELAYQYGEEESYALTKELPIDSYEIEYAWLDEYDVSYRGSYRVTVVTVTEWA